MNLNLREKVIIVSGGAKGIGQAIVSRLALEEAYPVIIDRDEAASQRTLEAVSAAGGFGKYVIADLTNPADCERAVNEVLGIFGRIDGLVNNAGLNDGVSLESGTYEAFMASLHMNLVHYYLLAKFCLPSLKQTVGSIVNITSKVAETGQGGTSAYAASNGGRNGLTREWAVELLPYGIRVNAVVVAESYTDMYKRWIESMENPEEKLTEINSRIPLGNRMTAPEEIANAVAFLLSKKSSHTTGQFLHVDGGYVHLDRRI